MQGTGNSLIEGSSFGAAFNQGLFDAAVGGVSGGISAGLTSGIQSVAEGGNFWKGSYPGIPHGPVEFESNFRNTFEEHSSSEYTLYKGFNPESGETKYIGITRRDPIIR